jgi:hypothetical protein
MDSKQQYQVIKNYLEQAYTGARMSDDIETQTRLARALIAFESDPEKDIFLDNVIEDYIVSQ